jgi:hypothetical protein
VAEVRRSARALLTDPAQRALLIRVHDEIALTAADPDHERHYHQEFRWWDLDEPELGRVRVFPEGFAGAAREVLRSGPPAQPRLL